MKLLLGHHDGAEVFFLVCGQGYFEDLVGVGPVAAFGPDHDVDRPRGRHICVARAVIAGLLDVRLFAFQLLAAWSVCSNRQN